ncbi:hypothetical protein CDAR_508401, partial [Caerostris darwini]
IKVAPRKVTGPIVDFPLSVTRIESTTGSTPAKVRPWFQLGSGRRNLTYAERFLPRQALV